MSKTISPSTLCVLILALLFCVSFATGMKSNLWKKSKKWCLVNGNEPSQESADEKIVLEKSFGPPGQVINLSQQYPKSAGAFAKLKAVVNDPHCAFTFLSTGGTQGQINIRKQVKPHAAASYHALQHNNALFDQFTKPFLTSACMCNIVGATGVRPAAIQQCAQSANSPIHIKFDNHDIYGFLELPDFMHSVSRSKLNNLQTIFEVADKDKAAWFKTLEETHATAYVFAHSATFAGKSVTPTFHKKCYTVNIAQKKLDAGIDGECPAFPGPLAP